MLAPLRGTPAADTEAVRSPSLSYRSRWARVLTILQLTCTVLDLVGEETCETE